MARKPTILKTGRVYPRVEVRDGRIMMQNSPFGNWKKVPLGRATYIQDRLKRAIKHIKSL